MQEKKKQQIRFLLFSCVCMLHQRQGRPVSSKDYVKLLFAKRCEQGGDYLKKKTRKEGREEDRNTLFICCGFLP